MTNTLTYYVLRALWDYLRCWLIGKSYPSTARTYAHLLQGTRLHIYRWLDSETARQKGNSKQLHALPLLETKSKWTKKIHPGLSAVA